MYGGSAPEPPDPNETAEAQAKWGGVTAQMSSIINNPNTVDPYGSTTYDRAGWEASVGPDGQVIWSPRYTKTTELSDDGQRLLDQKHALGDTAYQHAAAALGYDSFNGLPNWQTDYDANQFSTDFAYDAGTGSYEDLQNDWQTNQLRTNYGPEDGFSADRRRVEDAMMSRANELLGQSRESEVARLAAQGLAPGSENYGRVADQFERSANDLAMQAVLAGGQEQSRLLGEARSEADFYNQARQGQVSQAAALQQMENARRMGDMAAYNSALTAYNQAIGANNMLSRDKANFNNAVRNAMFGENEAYQNNTLNRLAGITSGVQVNNPAIPNYVGQNIQAPDYAGLVQNNYANEVAAYNAEQAGMSSLLGGGLGLIGKLAGGIF